MAGGIDGISKERWDRWWKEDWSWEGLAKKPWRGWVVPEPGAEPEADEEYDGFRHPNLTSRFGAEAREATLQDYWRDQSDRLVTGPDGIKFTRLHLPFEWQDGKPTGKADWHTSALNDLVADRLNHVNDRAFEEERSFQVDWSAQFQGGVFLRFRLSDLELNSRSRSERPHLSIRCNTCVFAGETSFDRVIFAGLTSFEEASFATYASFGKAVFTGSASFYGSGFASRTSFNDSVFHGRAWFEKAVFDGDASFEETAFDGPASFQNASFVGAALFDKAVFASRVWFQEATFERIARFREIAFAEDASFDGASFVGDASFDRATFAGLAGFQEAAFACAASFNKAAFVGYAWFHKAAFAGEASFDQATFAGPAWFHEAAFADDARFHEAAFAGQAWFSYAAFAGDAWFTGKGASVATDSIVGKLTSDSEKGDFEIDIPQRATWIAQRSFPNASFERTLFLGKAKFDNRDFHSETSFENSVFLRPAAFHDSKLHRGITFRNTWFQDGLTRDKIVKAVPTKYQTTWDEGLNRLFAAENSTNRLKGETEVDYGTWLADFNTTRQAVEDDFSKLKSEGEIGKSKRAKYFGELEDCYRTLKQLMEDRRDRHEEGRFHKLELRARRKRRRPAVNISEQWMSHLYGWSADYGNSVLLPIIWLLVGSVIFAGLYTLMGTTGLAHIGRDLFASNSAADWGETLSYSFSRVFPFGGWGDPDQCSMIGQMLAANGVGPETSCDQIEGRVDRQFIDGTPLALKALTTYQSISAIILIFLAGLAARRKFQIN